MARSRFEVWILALSLLGLALSLYAFSLHYATTPSKLCNIGTTFNCDKVNKSPWSEFLGIPVAGLGTFAYLALFLLVLRRKAWQRALAFTNGDAWMYLTVLVLTMFVFQAYLTLAEILWIHAYCLVCLCSQLTILSVLALSARSWQTAKPA